MWKDNEAIHVVRDAYQLSPEPDGDESEPASLALHLGS